MDEFSAKWESIIDDVEKKGEPLLRNVETSCDISKELFVLVDDFTKYFFFMLPRGEIRERILFCAFLWIHNVCLSRFDYVPERDFPYLWSQFSRIFDSVAAQMMPFNFTEQFSKLYMCLNFYETSGVAEQSGEVTRIFLRFFDHAKTLSSSCVKSESFEASLKEFHNLKSAIYRKCRQASPESDGETLLPAQLFSEFASVEYILNVGLLFVRMKESVSRINSAINGKHDVIVNAPSSESDIRSFLQSSLKIVLLENRLFLDKDNNQDNESTTLEKESEIHKLLSVISVNKDRSLCFQLWTKDFISKAIADVTVKFKPRSELEAIERLGTLIHCFMFDNTVMLRKFEEFKRIFLCLTRASTIFQFATHCLILLVELRSLARRDEIIRAVDAVIEKLERRIGICKFMGDQRRILWVMRAYFKSTPEEGTLVGLLTTLKMETESMCTLGLMPMKGTKPLLLSNYQDYLDILIILAKSPAGVPEELIHWHPSAGLLSESMLSHPNFVEMFREFSMSGRYAAILRRPSRPKGSSHVDFRELQEFVSYCEREVLRGCQVQVLLLKFSAMAYFLRQVSEFNKEYGNKHEMELRIDNDEVLQVLFNDSMKLLRQNDLFTESEQRQMALCLGNIALYLFYSNWDGTSERIQSVINELYQSFAVPRCQSLLGLCYEVLDYFDELGEVYTALADTIGDIKKIFTLCFEGSFESFERVKGLSEQLVSSSRKIDPDLGEKVQKKMFYIEKFLILVHVLCQLELSFANCDESRSNEKFFVKVFCQINHLRLIRDELDNAISLGIEVENVENLKATLASALEHEQFSELVNVDLESVIMSLEVRMPRLSEFLMAHFGRVKQYVADAIQMSPSGAHFLMPVDLDNVYAILQQYASTGDRFYLLRVITIVAKWDVSPDSNAEFAIFCAIAKDFVDVIMSAYCLLQTHRCVIRDVPEEEPGHGKIHDILCRLQEAIKGLQGDESILKYAEREIEELKKGRVCKVFTGLSSQSPDTLFKMELEEIRHVYQRAEAELQRIRSQKAQLLSTQELKKAIAALKRRNERNTELVNARSEEANALIERLAELNEAIAKRFSSPTGVPRLPPAINRLLSDDTIPRNLVTEDRGPREAIERRISDAAVLNLRLKREIERLQLPSGDRHITEPVLKDLMDSLSASTGQVEDWAAPEQSETAALSEELREMQKEAEALYEAATVMKGNIPQPSLEFVSSEIDRLTEEILCGRDPMANVKQSRAAVCNFSAKADQLFRLMYLEKQMLSERNQH